MADVVLNPYLVFAAEPSEVVDWALQQGVDPARCTWAGDVATVEAAAVPSQLVFLSSFWSDFELVEEVSLAASLKYPGVEFTIGVYWAPRWVTGVR